MNTNIKTVLGITFTAAVTLGTSAFLPTASQAGTPGAPHGRHQSAETAKAPVASDPTFPYHGTQFTQFIQTSYKEAKKTPPDFYGWMDSAYKRSHIRFKGKENAPTLTALLASIKQSYLATNDTEKRSLLEKQTGAYLHKLVKKTIPKFSLDRGFEFYDVIQRGERQCYLQSTLVSGMMQAAGMKAGVVMIARNDHGQETNNGHAVTLIKMSDGRDLLVDVSHKKPFIKQQGFMVQDAGTGNYRYVSPQYAPDGGFTITGYAPMEANGVSDSVSLADVRPLPNSFMVSQFDYYRGERAAGGFFAKQKTDAGMEASAKYLQRAISEDSHNPLAQYVLGRVYLRQGKPADAKKQLVVAYREYDKYGFVPQGPRDSLALVHAAPQQVASLR